MNITTPELVATHMAQLQAEASAERLARVARVTAWAETVRRHPTSAPGQVRRTGPELQLRAPRL